MKGKTKCLLTASLTNAMFTVTVQNCVHQQRYMLDSVGGAIGGHVQRWQVFHAHVQNLRIFEQRDPHLSQLESDKQNSSDVPIKSSRDSKNREIGVEKELVHHSQSIALQKWHLGNCVHQC
ncbi:hypothetical protein AVEN_182953-1 [Araneus ventricosus]|uniref:Uncharacterized protein n=1 Tax=Araneus ventricosus TaxID=182803 RepID=A0A4Y2Q4B6_ARAVE|nr:hypothetical protein AVEN_182953-1 [Araneus ventricosus]